VYLLYDGHGSVRQITDSDSEVINDFGFDAYGNLLYYTSAPQTALLYTGEYYDSVLRMQYLRNRWTDPSTGRFNRRDEYPGSAFDPLSFHKYNYTHCNPINAIDPTGKSELSTVGQMMTFAIMSIMISANIANAPGPRDITLPDAGGEMIIDGYFIMGGAVLINHVIVPVARTSLKFIGRRLPFRARPPTGGPGKWMTVKENMSPRAARYQTQITSKPVNEVYVVDGVKLDGFKSGKLLDAKGPGYKNFIERSGKFNETWWRGRAKLLQQAKDQLRAAKGLPVEWHFAEKQTLEAAQKLLQDELIQGINLVHTPVQ